VDWAFPGVDGVALCPGDREARHHPSGGTTESKGRDPAIDLAHGMGESKLGCLAHHGELLLLGFEIAEPTVSRYLQRLNRIPQEDKAKRWRAFLNNDREVIAAFDLFTVPTLSFRTLYRYFAIKHGRRRILQFNVTLHPTSDWIVQQLREAFPLIVLIHTFYSTTMPSSAIRC
jgi:hypothetical protein